MKTVYILLFTWLLLLISCNENKKSTKDNIVLNKGLEAVVETYIAANPLKLPIKSNLYKNGYSYPSYHIFFRKRDQDTIMSIIQFSNLNDFEIESDTIKNGKNEEIYKSIEPDGFLIYKEKYPLVIFSSHLYFGSSNLKKYLTKTIPDSLKFNKENYHIDFVKWDYEIYNNNFVKIDLLNKIHTHQ